VIDYQSRSNVTVRGVSSVIGVEGKNDETEATSVTQRELCPSYDEPELRLKSG
jgi:hypothetical protein